MLNYKFCRSVVASKDPLKCLNVLCSISRVSSFKYIVPIAAPQASVHVNPGGSSDVLGDESAWETAAKIRTSIG